MSTTNSTSTVISPQFLPTEVYRMTVHEYERMVAAGVLDDPRVELLDGYVVKKLGKNPPHIWTVDAILESLKAVLPGCWWCRKEDPVRIPDFDEPEPDVAVVQGNRDNYRGRIPEPADIVLPVEVADSSLDRDRGEKRRAYARGGIGQYWIVNLRDRQVEVYSSPEAGDYNSLQVFKEDDRVSLILSGTEACEVPVAAILP